MNMQTSVRLALGTDVINSESGVIVIVAPHEADHVISDVIDPH